MTSDPNKAFHLDGEQTIRTIGETYRALMEHYADTPLVTIDVTNVTDADLTLIQLIQSLRSTSAHDSKKLCLKGPLPASIHEVLLRGGFLNAPDSNLFWSTP